MIRFFYVALSETRRSYLESAINAIREWNTSDSKVEVGILLRFNKSVGDGCLACKLAKSKGLPVFIDNGAFSYLRSLDSSVDVSSVARWLKEYALFIVKYNELFDFFALPDIPVHGRNFVPSRERARRIRLSARIHGEFLRMIPSRVWTKAVPVLQGYTVSEYEESYMLLEENGVLGASAYELSDVYNRVLAVGSVCVRKPSSSGKTGLLAGGLGAGTLDSFIGTILDDKRIPSRGFHFFGLHREVIAKYGLHDRFYASDSGAHGLNFRMKWDTFLDCKTPDEGCYARSVKHQLRITLTPLRAENIEKWV